MKKAILFTSLIGLMCTLMINCGDENPVTENLPVDTSNIDWPKMNIIIGDTSYSNTSDENFIWKIILDDQKKIDSLMIKDSSLDENGNIEYVDSRFRKQNLQDTITIINNVNEGGDGKTCKIIRLYSNGIYKDTVVVIYCIDNKEVEIVKGTFYQQDLYVGDILHLYVKVKSNKTPYVCQWYKDGKKIGDEFIKQGDDSICYDKKNIQLEDGGEYSITLNKPHANYSADGMVVNVRE